MRNQYKKPNYELLFKLGLIHPWFLREQDQIDLFNLIDKNQKTVVDVYRRYGKTTTAMVYINEQCWINKLTVRIGGVTQKAIKDIYNNVQEHIYSECPKLLPKFDTNLDAYVFPTGSKIHLFGNANSEEQRKSRGSESDIIYLDEFGFWKFKPKETLYSILIPQLQHSKLGKIIITSTMPKDLTHEYMNQCREAAKEGYLYFHTLRDAITAGTITQAEYDAIAKRMGGENSEDFKREYLLEEIASTKDLVIPEAQDQMLYVGETVRPEYYNAYVSMDLGLRDHTAALFCFYDFKNAKLVVEDEYWTNYTTTEKIVADCKYIEQQLQYSHPPKRYSDCEMQQIFDMNHSHGYVVQPVEKRRTQSDKPYVESLINGLRIAIKSGRILIHPKCLNIIMQLKFGIWDEDKRDFERTEAMGHLDSLIALAYLWDLIDKQRNPYPIIQPGASIETHHIPKQLLDKSKHNSLAMIIGKKF